MEDLLNAVLVMQVTREETSAHPVLHVTQALKIVLLVIHSTAELMNVHRAMPTMSVISYADHVQKGIRALNFAIPARRRTPDLNLVINVV